MPTIHAFSIVFEVVLLCTGYDAGVPLEVSLRNIKGYGLVRYGQTNFIRTNLTSYVLCALQHT